MTEPALSLLIVAGALGLHDDGWSVVAFLDRLEAQGISAQVVCVEARGDAAADPRVVEAPDLGHRWRQPLAVRRLRLGERLRRPNLLHVLQTRLVDAGLALAEHWRLPYVQSLDEYLPADGALRLSRRWCRGLLASSRELAEELTLQFGVPPALLTVINPGIEAPEEAPARSRAGRLPVIGTAGPLVASSGFATFLNAARKVLDAGVDAEFVIAGQGEDEIDLRRRAERLRIADRVTFAGIPVVGLRFWSVLDVFCQPSHAPSVGRTLATALAFGVPSIASDIEGLRALVLDRVNGLRVPPGDSGALARLTLELLDDPDRAAALGSRGRERILRDFRPETEAVRLAAAYREALEREAVLPTDVGLVRPVTRFS